MKKIWKSLLLILLVCSCIVTTVFATPASQLRDEKEKAEKELKELEDKMASLMTKINKAEAELVDLGGQIVEAEEELVVAEEKRDEQYEAMKLRIVAMYESDASSMLEMILESGSIAEMLKRADNIQTVHEYDRKELEEFVKNIEKIEALKESLEKDMKAVEKKQKKFEKDKEDLNDMIADLEDEIDDLDDRIADAVRAAAAQNSSQSSGGSTYIPPVGSGGGSAVVAAAYKYLNVPYKWGGTSMKGVDCSGLVMLAHRAAGISLPRTSGPQGSGGRPVSRAEAQPGDVVCYSGHVGIYLGNGMMIHAPHTGDVVRVAKVYGSPWYRRWW